MGLFNLLRGSIEAVTTVVTLPLAGAKEMVTNDDSVQEQLERLKRAIDRMTEDD